MSLLLADFLSDLKKVSENTPDFLDLKKGKEMLFPIFIYDSLQVGKHNFKKYLEGAIYFGRAATSDREYISKKNPAGKDGDPVIFKAEKNRWGVIGDNAGSVAGDLFGVGLRHLAFLDYIYDNTVMSERKKIYIKVRSKKPDVDEFAFAYTWLGVAKEFEAAWGPINEAANSASIVLDGRREYLY